MSIDSGKSIRILKKALFERGGRGNLLCSTGGAVGLIAQVFPLLVRNAPAGDSHTSSTAYIWNFLQTGGGSWPFSVSLIATAGISLAAVITGPSRIMTVLASAALISLWGSVIVTPLPPADLGFAAYLSSAALLLIAIGIIRV